MHGCWLCTNNETRYKYVKQVVPSDEQRSVAFLQTLHPAVFVQVFTDPFTVLLASRTEGSRKSTVRRFNAQSSCAEDLTHMCDGPCVAKPTDSCAFMKNTANGSDMCIRK